MLKRTLFFGNPYHLSTRQSQLLVRNKDSQEEKTMPIEDLGFVVFEHPQITFSQSVMQLMAENNTAVIFCDNNFMPSSMLLHLDTNTVQTKVFRHQINASEPLKKQIWQQSIKSKIKNQAASLHINSVERNDSAALLYLAKNVKSGDSTNREGEAARRYWRSLLGKNFRRERFGEEPNPALNYGYTILRAATARALSGSGLLPTIGIHHKNKYNSFCLADDIMEPYRPYVDLLVMEMREMNMNCEELGTEEKAQLLQILNVDVRIGEKKRPLMIALSETSASLAKVFKGELKSVKYPVLK